MPLQVLILAVFGLAVSQQLLLLLLSLLCAHCPARVTSIILLVPAVIVAVVVVVCPLSCLVPLQVLILAVFGLAVSQQLLLLPLSLLCAHCPARVTSILLLVPAVIVAVVVVVCPLSCPVPLQVLILAVFGLAVSSALSGVMARMVFSAYGWNWTECLMFGSIISATDPVAVVALLNSLGLCSIICANENGWKKLSLLE